jgi:nucleotide-binding universal stress UspA family protein
MYRRIIVGHDLHSGGSDALALGRQLAKAADAELVVAGIFPIGALPTGFESSWIDEQERVAREIQSIADEAGAEAEAFVDRSPASGLHGLAEETDADLVIVGSSRHSKAGQILAGNVGLGLLHGAPCAVAIAPRGYAEQPADISTVVVGFDGGQESRQALEAAVDLAEGLGAIVKLVAVTQEPAVAYGKGADFGGLAELKEAIEDEARTQLKEGLESIGDSVPKEGTLVTGGATEELAKAAASPGSILVLGSRGYGPLRRVLLGSVSTALMRTAPCPVLVHPRGAETAPRASRTVDTGTVA